MSDKLDITFEEAVNWVIEHYGGALKALAEYPEPASNTEEVIDLRKRILKLNNNIFDVNKFNFNNLHNKDYITTVLMLKIDNIKLSERCWRDTNKEYVSSFKVNQKGTLSRKEAALFWFFRLTLGVL
jgi:hypothetical protein